MRNFLYLLLMLLIFSSCAISRNVTYDAGKPKLSASGKNISIAVWDQRSQILDGSRDADFVGYTRSGVGIAYPMGTKSGDPLASDIKATLSNSLSNNNVHFITTSHRDQEQEIVDRFKRSNTDKLILLKLNDYYTDGFGKQTLHHDILLKVIDQEGNTIEEKRFEGEEHIGGSTMWGPGKYKKYMPKALEAKLEEIFNDPAVKMHI